MDKKQENLETQEWDYEADLDLGAELQAPLPKNAYERALAAARGGSKGLLSGLGNRSAVTDIVNRTLPMGYGTGYRMAADLYETGDDLYHDISKEVSDVADSMKETTSRLLPSLRKALPEKFVAKLEQWAGTRRSAQVRADAQNEEELLASELDGIFGSGGDDDAKAARDAYLEVRKKQRDDASFSQLDAIRSGIHRMVNYQDRVLVNYQRRSLELQIRQLQVSAKMLDISREYSITSLSALDVIKEELAKPDLVRLQEHPLTRNTYGVRGERERRQGMFGRGINPLNRMRERLQVNARQLVSDMAYNLRSGLQSANDNLDQRAMNAGIGANESSWEAGGRAAGEHLPSLLARRFGSSIRSRLNQNERLRSIGNRIQYGAENLQQNIRERARGDVYERDAEGNVILDARGNPKRSRTQAIAGYLKNLIGDDRSGTHIEQDTVENLQAPASFSRQNSRTLNTIIPGLLARIHREISILRTGDENVELITYDLQSGEFKDSSSTARSVIERLRSTVGGDSVRNRAFELVDEIDSDGTLTEQEREQLARKLLRDNYDKRIASPERLTNAQTYSTHFDEEQSAKMAALFQAYYANDTDGSRKTQFSRGVNALGNEVSASRLTFQDHVNTGMGEYLTQAGLIRNGQIDVDRLVDLYVNDLPPARQAQARKENAPLRGMDSGQSPNQPGSIASGTVALSTMGMRALRGPLEFMNKLRGRRGGQPIANLGGFAAGLSSAETIPIMLNEELATRLDTLNTTMGNMYKLTKESVEGPVKGSSEYIRSKREKRKQEEEAKKQEQTKSKGMFSGLLGALGGKLFGKSAADEEEDDGDTNVYVDASGEGKDKKDKKKSGKKGGARGAGKATSGTKAPKGKTSWLRRGFNFGKKAVGFAGRTAATAARFLLPTAAMAGVSAAGSLGTAALMGGKALLAAGGAIAGTAAAVLTSPITLTALAATAVGYGAYKGFKYLTRDKLTPLNQVRLAQYGLDYKDESMLHRILEAELVLGRCVNYDKNDIPIPDWNRFDAYEFYKALGLDERDTAAQARTTEWIRDRFAPIYLVHIGVLKRIANRIVLTYVEEMDKDDKIAYLEAIRYSEGPYDADTNPFSDDQPLPSGAQEVESVWQVARAALGEVGKSLKERNKSSRQALEEAAKIGTASAVSSAASQASTSQSTVQSAVGGDITKDTHKDAIDSLRNSTMSVTAVGILGQELDVPVKIDSLSAIRYKLYGLVDMNIDKIQQLRELEREVIKSVTFDSDKNAVYKGSMEEAVALYGKIFGVADQIADKGHAANFVSWFNWRFLPVYLTALGYVRRETRNEDLEKGSNDLDSRHRYQLAQRLVGIRDMSSGEPRPLWFRWESPWLDGDMGTDARIIDANMKVLKELSTKMTVPEEELSSPGSSGSNASSAANQATGSGTGSASDTPSDPSSPPSPDIISRSATNDHDPGQDPNGRSSAYFADMNAVDVANFGQGTGGMYQSLPDPKGDGSFAAYKDLIYEAAKMTGTDPLTLAKKFAVESGFKAKSKAGTGSAKGLGQFIDSTWKNTVKAYGSKYGIDERVGPNDPKANILMTIELMKESVATLRRRFPNMKVTDTELYILHFLGAPNAMKFFGADDRTVGASLLPDSAASNKTHFYEGNRPRTVGEIRAHLAQWVADKAVEFGVSYGGSGGRESSTEEIGGMGASYGISNPTGGRLDRAAIAQAMNSSPSSYASGVSALSQSTSSVHTSASPTASSPTMSQAPDAPIRPPSTGQNPMDMAQENLKASYDGQVGIGEVLLLTREQSQDYGTFGTMTLPDGTTFQTLELPWRDNKTGVSCIPAGSYETEYRKSPRLGVHLYALKNVKGRSGILIHSGNVAGDKSVGLASNVEGCILLGLGRGEYNGQPSVTRSKDAMADFTKRMGGRPFTLIISGGGTDQPSMLPGEATQQAGSQATQAVQTSQADTHGLPSGFSRTNPFSMGGQGAVPGPMGPAPAASLPSDVFGGFTPDTASGISTQRNADTQAYDLHREQMDVQRQQLMTQSDILAEIRKLVKIAETAPDPTPSRLVETVATSDSSQGTDVRVPKKAPKPAVSNSRFI